MLGHCQRVPTPLATITNPNSHAQSTRAGFVGHRLPIDVPRSSRKSIAGQTRTLQTRAVLGNGPAYNKYKSRQEIERDYYRDWERTTLIAQEELDRPMTIFTFLSFLPAWFKFYGLPGPVRFVVYLVYKRLATVLHAIHKKLVVAGAKLDRALILRSNLPVNTLSRKMVLLRYHHRISWIENLKYRVALARGRVYSPKVKAL